MTFGVAERMFDLGRLAISDSNSTKQIENSTWRKYGSIIALRWESVAGAPPQACLSRESWYSNFTWRLNPIPCLIPYVCFHALREEVWRYDFQRRHPLVPNAASVLSRWILVVIFYSNIKISPRLKRQESARWALGHLPTDDRYMDKEWNSRT